MPEHDGVTLTSLAGEMADLRERMESAKQTMSHLRDRMAMLEAEMLKRQQPPEDWE